MVLCCFNDAGALPAEEDTYTTTQYGGAAYPGQRPLVKTAGNALMDAPAPMQSPKPSELVVGVTVPPGVTSGDTIQVNSPDGRRSVNAVVPPNMMTGQSFMVRFPAESVNPNPVSPVSLSQPSAPGFAHSLDNVATQSIPVSTAQPTTPVPQPIAPSVLGSPAYHQTAESRQEEMRVVSQPPEQQAGFADSINTMLSPSNAVTQQPATPLAPPPVTPPTPVPPTPQQQQQQQQKFLMVNVPPGTAPGSTLHVKVPGENRTLSVTVPSGVTTFRVAYASTMPSPPQQQQQQQQQTPQTPAQDSTTKKEQKLLLVKVPPGTSAGATLHVAVPDEPGRILAAQVPPNVSQFHVAYEPRGQVAQQSQPQHQQQQQQPQYGQDFNAGAPPSMNPAYQQQSGMMPMANPSYQQQSGMIPLANPYNHQPQQQNYRPSGGGAANYVLPALGAAALGTAAFATYDHFAHHSNGGGDDNFEDSGAVADFGGDDFDF